MLSAALDRADVFTLVFVDSIVNALREYKRRQELDDFLAALRERAGAQTAV
ncbi:MAG: hypothetical protein QM711_03795 [Micropruina sp.]|uniref:hypothetical protein n=1 Tax=Micropruina sp. TaxID=2737536 RepID=UPI0039E511F9